jgi:hypothetical protein
LKENFHQFKFKIYKEKEMSDFRKYLLALAVIALALGSAVTASAQTVPILCGVTAQPLTVRTEGLAEQVGDVVITCSGGNAPTSNTVNVPVVNISVTLSTNITSRLLSGTITESLLFIDDPGSAANPTPQNPCAPSSGSTVCAPFFATSSPAGTSGTLLGGASTTSGGGAAVNVFQGVQQAANTVVFLAVPINAPGTNANRIIRIKNLRAAVAGSTPANGQILAFVSIQNPPANLQLNNATAVVAFVQQGLTFTTTTVSGQTTEGGFTTSFAQCVTFNNALAGAATGVYGTSGSRGRSFLASYTEGYAASWKVRDVNAPLTEPGLQQNDPTANSGTSDPTLSTVVESGFYNTAFTATNGLNRAGRADHGTRLRLQINNIPANVLVYVSAGSVPTGCPTGAAAVTGGACGVTGSGGSSTTVSAYYVSTDANGRNVAAGTVLGNPLSTAEQGLSGSRYPAGAAQGLIQVTPSGGTAVAVWEVFGQTPNAVETANFVVTFAYRSGNNPGLGTVSVNGSFAPLSTVNTMADASVPVPRFADTSSSRNVATIATCVTNLLFPFVANTDGFDTGIAISNTSADPFGTTPQTGNCTLYYYGQTTGGGAAPANQTTTTPLAGGQHMTFSLSSGGTNGVAATPGFRGYMIATCAFRYAHGFAFISDVGAQRLSHGYLALILDTALSSRTGQSSESLGQ